jgi:L-amino acid N-acyltransferase YncA
MHSAMKIRLARPDDGEAVAAIYAPIVRETAISFETTEPTAAEMAARIAGVNKAHAWLVAEDAGEVTGYVYAGRHRDPGAYAWSTNTSVYLRADARGKGLGRTLYHALFTILTAQNYRTAFAGIALPNAASVRLHESVGFKHLGTYAQVGFKFGRWHDVGWWQQPLVEGTHAPTPTVPLSELGDVQARIDACWPPL